MVGLAGIGALLLSPTAAPVPAPPPAPVVTPADRKQAMLFANVIYNLGVQVHGGHVAQPALKDLFAGAVRGLYEAAGMVVPDEVLQAIAQAGDNPTELQNVLIETRVRLGNLPALSGPRSLFAAANGFRHATDPYCTLANAGVNRLVSSDMEFDGLGFELEGATGHRWNIYRMEREIATGQLPPTGTFGPVPKPDAVPSPANFPWRVKKVVPGSPAQRAGVKPGDIVTHLNGDEVTADTANKLFALFSFPPGGGFDPNTGQRNPVKRSFKLRRAGVAEPIALTLTTEAYAPEAVFGVMRTAAGKWDCLLDREFKIGYIRIAAIEEKSETRVGEMLDDLTRQGCRALILDLRWCPGGYVTPGTSIAGMFLKPNEVIAEVRAHASPNGLSPGPRTYRAEPALAGGKFLDVPVLVLVGAETTGGGELIAAALQDNKRCETMGQRTAGRAAVQLPIEAGFGRMQYKVTYGATLRPNGKPRGKLPDSKPTDDWGIRPDAGLEVPVTADLSAKLRLWAEEHALRTADSREALAFDDPAQDPYRAAALTHLRKSLGKAK